MCTDRRSPLSPSLALRVPYRPDSPPRAATRLSARLRDSPPASSPRGCGEVPRSTRIPPYRAEGLPSRFPSCPPCEAPSSAQLWHSAAPSPALPSRDHPGDNRPPPPPHSAATAAFWEGGVGVSLLAPSRAPRWVLRGVAPGGRCPLFVPQLYGGRGGGVWGRGWGGRGRAGRAERAGRLRAVRRGCGAA